MTFCYVGRIETADLYIWLDSPYFSSQGNFRVKQ